MTSCRLRVVCLSLILTSVNCLWAVDTVKEIAAPAWAVGQANRTANFDVLPGFQKPPPGFGVVPFYWWLGDPLTKERLSWQLEQMSGMGVAGYQINYAHTDRGGRSYGLTYPSKPALFSDEWWQLVGWFMAEAKKQGAGVSLSDYTLGFGQGWCVDEILREHPDVLGQKLELDKDGKVTPRTLPWSLNPLHPQSGRWYADKFFGQFERHFPGEGGKGLNFFFSDELQFGVNGHLWSDQFAAEFKKRKGYDIVPELPALFKDVGPRTPKIRLDYNDVATALTEEGFFKPLFDWHQERGMTMGCDHGGRGRNVVEFGDYYRTQRWNQGPGSDQPHLGKDVTKAKVAASIAHLYERPRVWLEGFYGSGWGTSSAGVVDATFANYVMGYNLFGIHGMYYSTHGGWWEWAPPDNTFRMPYWKHLRGFMDCVQRLSYLLSQGHHRCDVAILYPVAPMEAGLDGGKAVEAAFSLGGKLYAQGIDFDYIDFQSLNRAEIADRELRVAGERYRMLVLPGMKAIRHTTLEKAAAFKRAGGNVVAVGALPEASDRIGRDDPQVATLVKELFPQGATADVMEKLPPRDYAGPGIVQHRRIGERDVYVIYQAPLAADCTFRATGKAELWDPWTGISRPLAVTSQRDGFTQLKLPLGEKEIQLIVFSPGKAEVAAAASAAPPQVSEVSGDWEFELQPTCDNRFGDFHWPPTKGCIGAEVRQLWYVAGDNKDGMARRVTCTFGPQFLKSNAPPPAPGTEPVEFSWRYGLEHDPGHQGYHGLKAEMHNELFAIGQPKKQGGHMPTVFKYDPTDKPTYLATSVVAPKDLSATAHVGAVKPAKVWLNGEAQTGNTLKLKGGANSLVLEYTQPGRTYYVVSTADKVPEIQPGDLATVWWNNASVLPFDIRADEKQPVGWYRFQSPPGLTGLTLQAKGRVQVWANGAPLTDQGRGKFTVSRPEDKSVAVEVRIEHERGFYGGAALAEPIRLECGRGLISLGDWAKIEGLLSYSGGAWYRKTVSLPEVAGQRVMLDLGQVVASAEVRINGQLVGIKVAPPWRLDITKFVHAGENRVEVLVCNTLANHYTSIPTNYRGDTKSGLLGPVRLEISK